MYAVPFIFFLCCFLFLETPGKGNILEEQLLLLVACSFSPSWLQHVGIVSVSLFLFFFFETERYDSAGKKEIRISVYLYLFLSLWRLQNVSCSSLPLHQGVRSVGIRVIHLNLLSLPFFFFSSRFSCSSLPDASQTFCAFFEFPRLPQPLSVLLHCVFPTQLCLFSLLFRNTYARRTTSLSLSLFLLLFCRASTSFSSGVVGEPTTAAWKTYSRT